MHMTLGRILRLARETKGLSQLELSLALDVSQRHISYVEANRARASRELILAWVHAVDAPLEVRNAALHHSGFSCEDTGVAPPVGSPEGLGHQLELLKSAAIPFPLLLFNANWQLLGVNAAAAWLASETMPGYWADFSKRAIGMSMIDVLVDPDGLFLHMANAKEAGASLLRQIDQESWTNHGLAPAAERLSQSLARRYGVGSTDRAGNGISKVALKLVFETRHGTLSFFPVESTLGHTQTITLESLRIAHWFPGDDQTRAVLRAHV